MDSGTNNLKPLLTIAIPTWNRAKTLDKALTCLIPQLCEFENEIQLIVSDNASTDETDIVVNKHKNENSKITFISNRNEENIQFFGNLSKCRELANGKYIWILSDDDFVKENLIRELITRLKGSNQCACVYLKNDLKLETFKSSIVSKEKLIEVENYSLGLISAVIFLNNKQNDKFLLNTYFESPFLGFIFLLNSFNYSNEAIIITGKCLIGANEKPIGYNFFDIFINGMKDVIDYMNKLNFPPRIVKKFRTSYLLNFILPIYFLYKAEGKLKFTQSELSPITDVNKWMSNEYSDLLSYWLYFFPVTITPNFVLLSGLKIRRKIKRAKR